MEETALITVFRVFVSGEPATFDKIDDAIYYLRSQAIYNKIESLSVQSINMTIKEYKLEVEKQEGTV